MDEKTMQSSLQKRIFSEIRASESCSLRIFHKKKNFPATKNIHKNHGKETYCMVFIHFEWKLHYIFNIYKSIQ